MRRTCLVTATAATILLAAAAPALAESATLGGTTASSVGPWVKPTGCSQFPVEYAGVPADSVASISVLDAVTRSSLGSTIVIGSKSTAGRKNVQVCSFRTEDTTSILLSLEVSGLGAVDSAAFSWSPRPNTVRCVNKRTYTIREYPGRKCPSGWVKG